MLSIYRLSEALAWLEKHSGREWTESELFDAAINCGVRLHAAAPITSKVTIRKFMPGEGLVEVGSMPAGHALLATLFPWQVAQLWVGGETTTSHPSDFDLVEGEYRLFTDPVHVTTDKLRVRSESLVQILRAACPAEALHAKAPHESEAKAASWELKKPQRFNAYSYPLFLLLQSFQRAGKPRPTARDVLACWGGESKPDDVIEVMNDGIKYQNNVGDVKVADLDAIRKAIGRMTDD